MFTLERVLEASSSAEATATFWAWKASQAGSLEAELELRSKMRRGTVRPDQEATQRALEDAMVVTYGRPSTVAGRIAVHQALLADLMAGLQEEPPKRDGVLYQTDYVPVGRMATALARVDPTGLPIRTTTSTHPDFAYVAAERGGISTVIHGDLVAVQAHLLEAHRIDPAMVVPLGALGVATA